MKWELYNHVWVVVYGNWWGLILNLSATVASGWREKKLVSCPEKKCIVPFLYRGNYQPTGVSVVSPSPLTISTYSIKASSKPITSRDETRYRHLNADAASTLISYSLFPCHIFTSTVCLCIQVMQKKKTTIQNSHLVSLLAHCKAVNLLRHWCFKDRLVSL